MMSPGFIHVAACVRISFFFKAEQYSIVCTAHILFICSSVNGHLGLDAFEMRWEMDQYSSAFV